MSKIFFTPWAASGDKTPPIPDAQQLDGSVSYTTGYGPDYNKQLGVDPAAKNIGREGFNSVLNDITLVLQGIQSGNGVPAFNAVFGAVLPGGGYPKNAVVPRSDGLGYWQNQTVNNLVDPTVASSGWSPLSVVGTYTQALTNVNVTLSTSNAAFKTIILTGTLTANVVITLPVWSGYAWAIDNRCVVGSFTVSVKTAIDASPVTLIASAVNNVFCDGTQLRLASTSTPGLSGFASWSTAGTFSWTVPAGVTKAYVRVIGGGGSGRNSQIFGPGGGGGGVAEGLVTLVPGTVITVTVGAGGVGVAYNATNGFGNPGGASSFGGFMSATGGGGGGGLGAGGTSGVGSGGTINSGLGDGQSSARATSTTQAASGNGGGPGGGGGYVDASNVSQYPPTIGRGPGGGGGGRMDAGGNSGQGAAGLVSVEW